MYLLFSLMLSLSHAEIVDKVVAIVNDDIITSSDILKFQKNAEKQGFIDDFLLLNTSVGQLKGDGKLMLDYLINEKIVDGEIKRLNLSVTSERVEQEIRDIAKRNGASRADLLTAIKNQGMSVSEYQNFLKTRIERQSLIESEISSKIRISDEEIEAEFVRQNPTQKVGISEYKLAQILFNPKKGGLDSALARAQTVLKKIRSGQSFEEAAEQNSEDPNFSSGGLLGTFKAGEFSRDIEAAVESLEPNNISDVVITRSGVYIFKLLARRTVRDQAYEKASERVRAFLFERSFQKHFKSWLELKRDQALVTVNAI